MHEGSVVINGDDPRGASAWARAFRCRDHRAKQRELSLLEDAR
jgi:hypothetical protein